MRKAHSLYLSLLREYGPQGWWPAESQYEIVVGALLTQNTNWGNVEKAIGNLKKAKALAPGKILKMKKAKLERLIRPSGFYRQKAERLVSLTKKYIEIKRKNPRSLRLVLSPHSMRDELLSVKGVGKETADSILLYAFGLPFFVIDAYTKKFCFHHRLFSGKEYDDCRVFFESSLPRSVPLYKEYHALIARWGKDSKIRSREAP